MLLPALMTDRPTDQQTDIRRYRKVRLQISLNYAVISNQSDGGVAGIWGSEGEREVVSYLDAVASEDRETRGEML